MGVQKILSTVSFGDCPTMDEDNPGVSPVLPRPERVQEHEISHIPGHDSAPLGAREGQEFGVGSLIPVGAEVECRDHIVSAFP